MMKEVKIARKCEDLLNAKEMNAQTKEKREKYIGTLIEDIETYLIECIYGSKEEGMTSFFARMRNLSFNSELSKYVEKELEILEKKINDKGYSCELIVENDYKSKSVVVAYINWDDNVVNNK